jgi:trehalose 6-phosphate phosphatase
MLIGSHGAEMRGQPVSISDSEGQSLLAALEYELALVCASAPGAWIERKPLGLTVHVRQTNQLDGERVLAEVRERLAEWPALLTTQGKAVIELSLSRTGKGDAVRWLRDDWGTNPNVLYLGDDIADEAAFQILGARDLGVKVGEGHSVAEHRVVSEREALGVLTFVLRCRALMNGVSTEQQLPKVAAN